MIMDSQVHIWTAPTPQRPWPTRRSAFVHGPSSFGVDAILALMDAARVARAVLVPAMCEGDRNDVALAAAKAHPDRLAVMGRVALDVPGARERIGKEIAEEGMLGMRLTFVGDESDLLTTGSADWVWDFAEEHKLPVMVIAPGQLKKLGKIASAHPGVRMAIDHMGLTPASDRAGIASDFSDLLDMARLDNVSVKASAFAWFLHEGFPFPSFLKLTRRAIDEFGADRIFWGTDISRLTCEYRDTVTAFEDHLEFRSDAERDAVMGKSLCRWLGWKSGSAFDESQAML